MRILTFLLGVLRKVLPLNFVFFVAAIDFIKNLLDYIYIMDDDQVDPNVNHADNMDIDLALNPPEVPPNDPFDDFDDEDEETDDDSIDSNDYDEDEDYGNAEEESYDDEDDEDEDDDDEDGDESESESENLNIVNALDLLKGPKKENNVIYSFKPLCLTRCNFFESNKDNAVPTARSGHRVIASDSHLYSLGGYHPRSAMAAARLGRCLLFQELWSYNYAAQRWNLVIGPRKGHGMPTELASTALTIYNNVLISHGGTGYPFGDVCSNDCYVYTTNEESALVAQLPVTGDLPMAQYGPTIVIHDDFLYTIGGTTGFDYSCDVYRLNLKTRVWENLYNCRPEIRNDPEGRYRHEVVYDNKYIYILGGGTSNSVYDLEKIPAFDLDKHTWVYFKTYPDKSVLNEQLNAENPISAGYPKPRKCFSCVQHTLYNGEIEAFICGGLQHFSQQSEFNAYFNDVWKLNLHTKQWTLIRTAKLPRPLYFHSAAHAGNNCMYIFGGIIYSNYDVKRRRDLYKMWMTIPKLSEICWDAVTYYNRDLYKIKRDILYKWGIPQKFIDRLPAQKSSADY